MTHVTSNERVINVQSSLHAHWIKTFEICFNVGQLNKIEFRFLSIFIQQSSLFLFYAIQYN